MFFSTTLFLNINVHGALNKAARTMDNQASFVAKTGENRREQK